MIKATKAPKPRYPQFIAVPYLTALLLAALAVVQLMGIGGFDFAGISYRTPGDPVLMAVLAGLEIFAIPFLLRLDMSYLARTFSALFTIVAPIIVWLTAINLIADGSLPANWYIAIAGAAFVFFGQISFLVLEGPKPAGFSKK